MTSRLPLLALLSLVGCKEHLHESPGEVRAFMAERGVTLPKTLHHARYRVEDNIPWIAYYLAFDVPRAEAAPILEKLWCMPGKGDFTPPNPREGAPWFSVEGLRDVKSCDTNGPVQGTLALSAYTGTLESGHVRILLSYSD